MGKKSKKLRQREGTLSKALDEILKVVSTDKNENSDLEIKDLEESIRNREKDIKSKYLSLMKERQY